MESCGICDHGIEGENYVTITIEGSGELVDDSGEGRVCGHCWEWAQKLLHDDSELAPPRGQHEALAD